MTFQLFFVYGLMIMSVRKTGRYTKTATLAIFATNAVGYADFCHPAVIVPHKIKLQNN